MNKCKICKKEFKPRYRTTEMFCSKTCENKYKYEYQKNKKPKPIKTVSKKRQAEIPQYKKLRFEFLNKPENKICFIGGCGKRANTVEHTRGRKGFADQWARNNNISLYLDVRYWKPCCLEHNLELENNTELSKAYQLSKLTGKKK